MTPQEYCKQKASGSSFYYSFMFLDKQRNQAITALYAFCREVDDVVDECQDSDVARQKLQWWQQEITNTYAGNPQHPVTRALAEPINQYNLPQEHFQEIIDGMEMDLDQTRYDSFKDLSLYCYRAASVVGLLAAEIFGYKNRQTQKYAHNLGMALQLTNILRDIQEDGLRGRIYLPLDELEQYGVDRNDILNCNMTPPVQALLKFQADRANDYFRIAYEMLPDEDRYQQISGLVMAAVYHAMLKKIERANFNVMDGRISLNPLHKLWIAWRTVLAEKLRHG